MKPTEVIYKSESGNYRVLFCRDALGMKYRVQMKDKYGHWEPIYWTDSPLDALNVMKRAAKEV